ncbi:MAG: alanyl-tRNA editing protein [Thermoplasmata archaeon]|nr:alanyl-tRNA editing protein [Thermoplasmata archaeon]
MTVLAYLGTGAAAYERSFVARVVALPPGAVVLDRTLFYPAGGGQPTDRGTLAGPDGRLLPVVDVVKSGSVVLHRLGRGTRSALGIDDEVHGEVDWERRYGHMRLHTAQHLLSAVVFLRTGRRTRKAVFAAGRGTIDLEGPWPEAETTETLSVAFAGYLQPPREVRIRTLPRSEWEANPSARSGLVPLPAQVDPVRVIEIDGIDTCPCGGTHLRSTGEVGEFSLEPIVHAADATRIGFALRTAAAHSDRVTP